MKPEELLCLPQYHTASKLSAWLMAPASPVIAMSVVHNILSGP
jgi:hypothetical protein